MSTIWKKYPSETPTVGDMYLVTVQRRSGTRIVLFAVWQEFDHTWQCQFLGKSDVIIAWTEFPDAYEGE